MDYQVRTIWNVIATIPGTVEPDRWVMFGNHRDAWVYGAVDPGSGTAATLETCRALGAAVKRGWKPRRTIVYASWDAEEYGLVGSTEWGEEHAKSIDEKVVLLLNVDSAVSGPELDINGVPSLRDLVLSAAGSITDPRSGKTLARPGPTHAATPGPQTASLVLSDPIWDSTAPRGDSASQAENGRRTGILSSDGLARLRLRLHGLPRPSRSSCRGRRVQGRLRGVSLDLR